jgi:heptosyltransferase-2
MPESVPKKILIRTPNWLGDLVMSTGFLRAVLESYPDSQIDIIVKSGLESLPLPHQGKIIIFDKNKDSAGGFGKSLRFENYDCFFVLPPSFSSAWMAFRSKIPKRIGYAGEFRSFLLSSVKKQDGPRGSQHLLKQYLKLLSTDLTVEKYPPRLEVNPDWVDKHLISCQFTIPETFIVFTPGAIYGPAKQWPIKHFRELATQLHQAFGFPILILGTLDDIEAGGTISQGHEWIFNYCGKTSLAQLLAILTKAKLLVGNDSGSMHLMGALQRPQIAIFGSTSPSWTAPINKHASVLSRDLFCSPCFARTCRYGHYDCLNQIKSGMVLTEAQKLLSS